MMKLVMMFGLALTVCGWAEEKDLLDEMFDEALRITKGLAKDVEQEDFMGEDTAAQVANEKAAYAAAQELLNYAKKSDDVGLKVRVLEIEFRWSLSDVYWQLEEADGKLAKIAARAKMAKYRKYLEKLEELKKEGSKESGE